MQSTTRSLGIAAGAILAAMTACGGAVESGPVDSGVAPGPDVAAPIVVWLGFDASDVDDTSARAHDDAAAQSAPIPCKERAVPMMCSKSDPPYYDAQSLEAAWIACGGTSGVANGCGVLTVAFDESGCASVDFSGSAALGGGGAARAVAEPCLEAKLGAYRFECSAGSGVALNHLCN
jgi:hypothetical protein